MIKNKYSGRSLALFIVAWTFTVLTVTGIILFIAPKGKVAVWLDWSLAGIEKQQWQWVHLVFGGIFIIAGSIHLYFNWKSFKKQIVTRVKGRFKPKPEMLLATVFTTVLFTASILNIPPASWLIELNILTKNSWSSSSQSENSYQETKFQKINITGAGLGRKNISELCFDAGISLEIGLQRLSSSGITATAGSNVQAIAEKYQLPPKEILLILTAPSIFTD